MIPQNAPPILGFIAYSGTGKTTLLTKLIPLFKQQGLRLAVIKHTHHPIDLDQPGKDSYLLRQSGADSTFIVSPRRWACTVEISEKQEVSLQQILPSLLYTQPDLILVEGFKRENYPKIEIHRPNLHHPLLYPQDPTIIAVATDQPMDNVELPQLDLNNPPEIVTFIQQTFALSSTEFQKVHD